MIMVRDTEDVAYTTTKHPRKRGKKEVKMIVFTDMGVAEEGIVLVRAPCQYVG